MFEEEVVVAMVVVAGLLSQVVVIIVLCYTTKHQSEASNAVIKGIVPIFFKSTSVLFDLRLTFLYVSAYFSSGFHSTSEPFAMPIYVSAHVEDCNTP